MAEPGVSGGDGAAVLDALFRIVKDRAAAPPEESYTAQLLAGGAAPAARKLGEEALETVIEAIAGDRQAVAKESADLLYHLLVLWVACDVAAADVWEELDARMGVSGLAEKAGRGG